MTPEASAALIAAHTSILELHGEIIDAALLMMEPTNPEYDLAEARRLCNRADGVLRASSIVLTLATEADRC